MTFSITQLRDFSVLSWITEKLKEQKKLDELRDQIRHERQQLTELEDDILRDIGITREQALRESARSYDDIPAKRLRFWVCCR